MKRRTFLVFVSPSVAIMLLLMVLPLMTAIWLGFNRITFKNLATPQWVGLQNYIEVLSDPAFWASLRFTLLYIVITVPSEILIGFFIALLLDQVDALPGRLYCGVAAALYRDPDRRHPDVPERVRSQRVVHLPFAADL